MKKLMFKATKGHHDHLAEFYVEDNQTIEVSDGRAQELRKDFPNNFFYVTESGNIHMKTKKADEAKQPKKSKKKIEDQPNKMVTDEKPKDQDIKSDEYKKEKEDKK